LTARLLPVVVTAIAFVLSVAAVRAMIAYTRNLRILDIPTARSSHVAPTPRGGGLGMLFTVVVVVLALISYRGGSDALVPLLAVCAVGVVGWLDDRGGLSVRVRFAVHLAAGAAMAFFAFRMGYGALWCAWWLFCSVSAINVVNFMDGIDGFVTSQSAVFCATLALLAPSESFGLLLACTIGGALLGFLWWNWPPARIFMGDVGSGSLGFLCVLVGAVVVWEAKISVVRAFLPLAPMVFDSAWTMLRRFRNGERLTEAHRSHLYQRLANGGWTHRRVTLLFTGAAVIGGVVALVQVPRWGILASLYIAAVIVVGALIDRTRPFAWRTGSRAIPSES
jgi:UDP-N-acetylmuramyl pentapeptide phosphotransferase/UDP-N-acetylglucosamine-1-phosphate transferase